MCTDNKFGNVNFAKFVPKYAMIAMNIVAKYFLVYILYFSKIDLKG